MAPLVDKLATDQKAADIVARNLADVRSRLDPNLASLPSSAPK
jgi:hypothetical protein